MSTVADNHATYETLAQAAKRTQLGERTLRRYIATGKLVAYRVGKLIRLKPEDVDALLVPTNSWEHGATAPNLSNSSVKYAQPGGAKTRSNGGRF